MLYCGQEREDNMDFEKWYTERQEQEQLNAFMADTKSHAAIIAAGVFLGVFISLVVFTALAVWG